MQNPFGNNGNNDDQNNNQIPIPPNFAVVKNQDGNMRIGKVGFSWTTLLFGLLPAIFRSDWYNFFCMVGVELIVGMGFSMAIGQPFTTAYPMIAYVLQIGWAGFYNLFYFRHLFNKGYQPADKRSKDLLISSHYLKED